MKKLFYAALILVMAVCAVSLTSCNDEDEDALKGICGTYEYQISGFVGIGTESFELPAETGILEIYETDGKEWNLKMVFASNNGRCFTAEGSSEDRSFFGMHNGAIVYTIDGDVFNVNMNGQGSIDTKGNIELALSLLGYGANSGRTLTNKQVHLLAKKK